MNIKIEKSTIFGDFVVGDKIVTYDFSNRKIDIPRRLNRIPNTDCVFGRDKVIEELSQKLKIDKQIILLNGIGGIGKSTISRAFINKAISENKYNHFLFIENKDKIKESFVYNRTLINSLGIEAEISLLPKDNYIEDAFELIIHKLSILGDNNLLVIDNADERDELISIKPILRDLKWFVIITSRSQLSGTQFIKVTELDDEDIIKLFCKYYGITEPLQESEDYRKIQKIGTLLEKNTLLIELTAKAANSNNIGLDILTQHIEISYVRHSDLQVDIHTGVSGERNKNYSQFAEYKIFNYILFIFNNFEVLTDKELKALKFLAIIPSQYYSIDEFISIINDQEWVTAKEDINKLVKKGWVDSDGFLVRLHRIIKEVILSEIRPNAFECKTLLSNIIDKLEYNIENFNEIEKKTWIPYADSILQTIGDEKSEVTIDLRKNLGIVKRYLGSHEDSKKHLLAALEENNTPNFNRLQILQELGIIHSELGLYFEACNFFNEALNDAKLVLPSNHPFLAQIKSDFATFGLNEIGRYEEALVLMKEANMIDLENYESNHPIIAERLSNLARIYEEIENYSESVSLSEKALNIVIDFFGIENPIVAVNKSNLAHSYIKIGKNEESIALLEDAIKFDKLNFGDKHPNLPVHYSKLARAFSALGEESKAIDAISKSLELEIFCRGVNHPYVGIRYENYADICLKYEKRDLAINFYEKSASIFESALGKHHPDSVQVRGKLEKLIMMTRQDF